MQHTNTLAVLTQACHHHSALCSSMTCTLAPVVVHSAASSLLNILPSDLTIGSMGFDLDGNGVVLWLPFQAGLDRQISCFGGVGLDE